VPTVIDLLSHESAPIRALATQTLGRIGVGQPGVEAALDRASRESNVAVQSAAKYAMQRIRAEAKGGNGSNVD
jgi:hypothetical protein